MLTTNMIRKDISAPNLYDASLALNGLACFMTPDLARDLANDVLTLTASSRAYLRKRAILVMYKIFLKVGPKFFFVLAIDFTWFHFQFPDALRPAFPRLKDRLEDPDTGLLSEVELRLSLSALSLSLSLSLCVCVCVCVFV